MPSPVVPATVAAVVLCATPWVTKAEQVVVTSGEIVAAHLDDAGDGVDFSIDRVTFTVTAGTAVSFDVLAMEGPIYGLGDLNEDGEITRLDSLLRLYRASDGAHLAFADDRVTWTPYSVLDSYLEFTFDDAGAYFVTLGYNHYSEAEGVAGVDADRSWQPVGWHADWRLTLTATAGAVSNVQVQTLGVPATPNPTVPEPAAATLLSAGLILIGSARRSACRLRASARLSRG